MCSIISQHTLANKVYDHWLDKFAVESQSQKWMNDPLATLRPPCTAAELVLNAPNAMALPRRCLCEVQLHEEVRRDRVRLEQPEERVETGAKVDDLAAGGRQLEEPSNEQVDAANARVVACARQGGGAR